MDESKDVRTLHELCCQGKCQKVRDLLEGHDKASFLIDMKSGSFGYTALHEAVCNGKPDVLETLIRFGGSVNVMSYGDYTPLHIAATIGNTECINVLLNHDADVSITDKKGRTALVSAIECKQTEACKLLRAAEMKKFAETDDQKLTPLCHKSEQDQGVDQACLDATLQTAVEYSSQKAIVTLIKAGAKNIKECLQVALICPELCESAVLLLMFIAFNENDEELVKLLLTDRAKDEQIDDGSLSPELLQRAYFPEEWNRSLPSDTLSKLRMACKTVDFRILVPYAVRLNRINLAEIVLLEMFCNVAIREANWQGMELGQLTQYFIRRIANYQSLNLSRNAISSVPADVRHMSCLSELSLAQNRIGSVPKEIFELKLLRVLNLSKNRITSLPIVDKWSPTMKTLNLQGNKLRVLDESIARSKLVELNLADNDINTVQSCLCDIRTLESLYLSRNRGIEVLPAELARLSNLKYLEIEEMNQLIEPPVAQRQCTFDAMRYLNNKLRNAQPNSSMKLMIVGPANSGKTTLAHRIVKDFNFSLNESTKGIDVKDISVDDVKFKCWDFAGQDDYYATHQCFLTERSLYVVVWNVTECEAGLETLRIWLENIESRVENAVVLVVGTHLDKVSQEAIKKGFVEEQVNKVFDFIHGQFQKITCTKEGILIITCSHERKNRNECSRGIERLRNAICNAAKKAVIEERKFGALEIRRKVPVIGEMIPASFLTLAKALSERQSAMKSAGKIPVLRTKEFIEFVEENVNARPHEYFVPDDLQRATRFLHDTGVILHYDNANQQLKDLYFIDPKWLFDLMAKIVTVNEAHSFIRNGILLQEHIPFIFKDDCGRFVERFFTEYLQLVTDFHIACRIDDQRVLVPSKLPSQSPSSGLHQPSLPLLRRVHTLPYISQGFRSRFICRFLLHFVELLKVQLNGLYHGPVDLSNLLTRENLICWRNGVVFYSSDLFLSVTLNSMQDGRHEIETVVTRSVAGYRTLVFIVDQIATLIGEWYRGFSGTDGSTAYVRQFASCPICMDQNVSNPFQFEITDCFKDALAKDHTVCLEGHSPLVVNLRDIYPELFFMDLDPSLILSYNDLSFTESNDNLLGEGSFAKVYKGSLGSSLVALKVYKFKISTNRNTFDALEHFSNVRREVAVLSSSRRHPYIVPFYGLALLPKLCLAIEYTDKGTLRNILKDSQWQIQRIVVYRIAQQVADAIVFLHSAKIIHRDLKSDNVLVFSLEPHSTVNVKVADLGAANFISPSGLNNVVGSFRYKAPEIISKSIQGNFKMQEYDSKVDVYSFSMLLYELMSRRIPFYAMENDEIGMAVFRNERPSLDDVCFTRYSLLTLKELMLKCWVQDPVMRPESKVVSIQLKSPSFYLLYGLNEISSNSCQPCFIQMMNELWMAEDAGPDGSSVVVLDMETTFVKQRFYPENDVFVADNHSWLKVSFICEIDFQHVALIFSYMADYVTIYSIETKLAIRSFRLPFIGTRALVSTSGFIAIAFENGAFLRMKNEDFVAGQLDGVTRFVVNDGRPISSMFACDTGPRLFVCCDESVYRYPILPGAPAETRKTNVGFNVENKVISAFQKLLFISDAKGSPKIKIFGKETLALIGSIDCGKKLNMICPNCVADNMKITCLCINGNTLWVGMGTGHLLIYQVKEGQKPEFITWLRPYRTAVESITAFESPKPGKFVVTTGENLNPSVLCYGDVQLCQLTTKLLHQGTQDANDSALEGSQISNKNSVILVWECLDPYVLKRIAAKP